ncbi:YhjD/YihY/BrkB family envelope integrity protein [Thiohalorhabdus sp.]|uniref:YhjD/YihY/BrkB family envelope integrity protein n=1 Tax=Thiohalorhabdus sp. TaxID=3094134 RepID=UPI002FC3487E
MADFWTRSFRRLERALWGHDLSKLPRWHAAAVRTGQILWALSIDLYEGYLTRRTTSLVYTTLLAMVPLLAFGFSVLQALGMHDRLRPLLLAFLEPLGSQREAFTERILDFVGNIEVGVLGTLGLAFLLFTVGSLIYKIESSFNFIWDIREARSWPQSLSGYLSVVFGGPLLVFTATGLTDTVLKSDWFQALGGIGPLGLILNFLTTLVIPFLLVVAVFTFLYRLIPNTHVPLRNALLGGVLAGVLWQVSGAIFGTFVGGSTRYAAIYSGFAIGLLFMIWLYLSWLIVLAGARITFYLQHPEYLGQPEPGTALRGRQRRNAGLQAMFLITQAFFRGDQTWTLERLEARMGIPRNPLKAVLEDLEAAGLLAITRQTHGLKMPATYLPAKDPDRITVKAVLDGVAVAFSPGAPARYQLHPHPAVEELLDRADQALERELGEVTLGSVVKASDPGAAAEEPAKAG